MQTGERKIPRVKKNYDLLTIWILINFHLIKEEFKHQFPAFYNYKIGLNKRR